MSTGEPAGEGGGGGGESTPGGDHSAGTPVGVTGIQSGVQTGSQHPPPSPLSGCYLLVVLPEPHTAQHKDLIINRLAKGFLSWDKDSCHVDLEKELQALVAQAPEGEEARNGERLIQYATENLVTEVLIHPQTNTLLQCIRNLLASFTKHRHIIHAGYTFSGNGSWILQDGTFSLADFLDAFSEHEVQRVLRAYENSVTVDIHCTGVGDWTSSRLSKEACTRSCRVRVNPDDVLTAGVPAISSFTNYVGQYLIAQTLDQLMEPSDVVGNIRFSHPTLYVFPGGQGDAALFGINGFNMLVDGGFARKACFWDFARHLDRLDAVLLTRVNNSNIGGMSSVLRKKQEMHVYPQIGHFFCNLVERRQANSPDGDKDVDPLILNLTDLGQEMMVNLRHINLRAHPCYRDLDPINLYHKVGHGTLDMYVLSPSKDTREVREFLTKWQASDSKLFAGSHKKDSNNLTFPIQNLVSICALLVWQPANPEDTITRILFPGSTPQNKIFEGLERLKHLEFMKHPVCSAKSLSPSTSLAALKEKSYKQKTSIIERSIDKDKDIKRVSDYRKEKKETLEQKTVKGVEESTPKPSVPSAPIIPTKQPAKVDVKAKKVVENKKIEKETKTESKKIERELKEVKKDHVIKKEAVKAEKQEIETKKTDVVKTETEKTVITKESKPKPEPKRKEIKETRTVVKSKVEATAKPAPKPPVAEKKLKPSIEKKDVKSSPTTPKKIVNGTASRTEITKTSSTKTTVKTTSRTVSAMPAKSAKDANNRKVVESKNIALSSTPAAPAAPKGPSVTAKPKSTDRKPISRRPKTGSPSKPRLPGSPAKSTRSTPTASVRSEKDGVIRRPKSDKGTTDSSAVSTPSAIEVESVVKMVDKSLTEKSDDISIDSIESKVLADLKEEREVVEEIEAVLSKAERNEIARKEDQAEGDDEITAEATDKKDEDVTEEDVTAEIEDAPKKIGSRKESQEFTEEDEYLIVEKEEIYTEDSALSGEGEQKHLLDEVESEKVKKYEISKDLDVPEEEEQEAKEKDELEEKEKDEKPEKKIHFHEMPEDDEEKPDGVSPMGKERLQEEVKGIIASATEIIQKTDERDDSGKKDSEDITKEPSSVSPDKFDSSEKKTTDTDLKPEADQKEQIPEKLEESQDRISTLESGATTTAPTLPEDERIPMDEIKEDVDEKYVKEEVKEKEIQPVKEKLQQEVPPPIPSTTMKSFVIRETVPAMQRDIVKTPDEVADLPVHEEVDPKLYDMDDFDKVKEDKVPQTPEAKEPPTPPVKEQKGMFSFFGKVADKFEKGMDKLTGKSKKDTDKESDEKSSKSSSPKETKPQEKTNLGEIDMGKVFAKVGKIEPHETFEKAKPQSPVDIKVAAIKETAAFLQQEIRETKIDTVYTPEPVIPSDLKHVEDPVEHKKEPIIEDIIVPKEVAQKLEATVDGLKEKASELIPSKEEIVGEDLVEDTKEVEALLEEASKKFVTVKDSLRDSLESLEDKIAEEIIEDIQPTKDPVKSTLVGVAERLEEFRPRYEDTADSKEPEKVKFEIPKDSEDVEDDSEEYAGPVRDLKEAVRDVGEVLAGTAGIVIDDKPKDVIEIVKKVAEVLKDDDFLTDKVLFDKPDQKDDISGKPCDKKPADSGLTEPEDTTDAEPIIEGIIMPKKVGVTEELPPQEEIEEMLEGGITRPLSAYERPGGLEVQEEPCIKVVKDPAPDVQTSPGDRAPIGNDLKDMCAAMMKDPKTPSPRESPKEEHKGKIDVMEAGIEEVCTKKQVKRDSAEDVRDEIEDMAKLEQPEIHFEQKLSPAQAELVMVTPDSAPTSPKFTSDRVYDKELEDALNDESKVPGVPKEIEEFISSKADVYDIIDEVIRKGRKITIEIIEYIVIVKKVSREHVIYIIEEIIINKGIPPDSVVENVDILRSQDSSNELIISAIKRVEIEEYIITEYIMKGKRITVQTIEEIAIKKVVPKRIIIEIIEEIIIKRKISRESVYEIVEEEFIKQVKPIYDEYDRQPHQAKPEKDDHEAETVVEPVKLDKTNDKFSPKPEIDDMIAAAVRESSEIGKQQVPEPTKEKDAPIFDEKDLDEGKLIDDFVNIPSKDAVLNFLQEERRLSHEEYIPEKKDSPTISKAATDDAVKDSGDDFEAVEQEYKVLDAQKATTTSSHPTTDFKDKDDVLEAVEDDLDDVVEAAEKFVEETKEKPEDLKESPTADALTDKILKADSPPVGAKTPLVPEAEDDDIGLRTPDEKSAVTQTKQDDASDEITGDSIPHATSVIASEILNATEKYLVEDKEKKAIDAEGLPKLSTETKQIIDDDKDAVEDVADEPEPTICDVVKDSEKVDHSHIPITDKYHVDSEPEKDEPQNEQKPLAGDHKIESPLNEIEDSIKDAADKILDAKYPTEKLDKSEPKKDDHPEETTTGKHDVGFDPAIQEPVTEDDTHVTDVKTTSIPEKKAIPDKSQDPEEKIEKEEIQPTEEPRLDADKKGVTVPVAQIPDIVSVAEKSEKPDTKPEQVDDKEPESADTKKKPSEESVRDVTRSPDELKDVIDDVKGKTEGLKGEDIVPDVSDVKILDTSEIVDFKLHEEKEMTKTEEIPTDETSVTPEHTDDTKIVDSSCFNIDHSPAPKATKEVVLDTRDKLKDDISKPELADSETEDAEKDKLDEEPAHIIRKKRSLFDDVVEPETVEPEEIDSKPTGTTKKDVDSASPAEEKEKSTPEELQKVAKIPSSVEQEIEKSKGDPEVPSKPDDDEEDKDTGTVRRMVVTASSEDGGHETEICPTGSILFGKPVTPDDSLKDSLKDISTKSTPDKDSLQMEKDSLFSGKSSPEKDSISEKSISELKDDKVTPEDSLEKSIHGHAVVTGDGRRKSHAEEPEEIKPVESDIPEKPVEGVLEKPTDKDSAKPADEVPEKSVKPTEDVAVKPTEEIGEKATEKPKEKVPEKLEETIPEKLQDEISEKPSEELPQKPEDKLPDQPTEKVLEKPTDMPRLKSPEPSESEEISPAESVFDRSPSEKLPSERPGQKPLQDKPEEKTDASRKSSIAPVEHDETQTLDDKLHKDQPLSPIEKLDEKDSPVEVQKAKSPITLPDETIDKSRSPSIALEDLKVKDSPDDEEHKDKSPSPTAKEHAETPKAPRVSPEESEEKHTPTDKLEREKSPSPSTDTLPDARESPDITSVKHEVKDVPRDELPGEKSPSPIVDAGTDKPQSPSTVSAELGHKDISPDKMKDRSPSLSPDKVPDQSRTPSITSERLDERDVPEDKDESETEKTSDKPQSPEEPHQKDSLDDKIHKDRTPSPVGEKETDKSPASSVTSETPDVKDILQSTIQKDQSSSPVADEVLDKSQPPSKTPEKPAGQLVFDNEVHKDRSPSPSTDKVTDRSRTPSISSGKPDARDIPEGQKQEDKSPASTPKDRSRTSSIASEKPEAGNIHGSTEEKDKTPSPISDEKLDKSRTSSIIPTETSTEQVAPDDELHEGKSPSSTPDKLTDKSRTPSISSEKLDEKVISQIHEQKDTSPSPTSDEKLKESGVPCSTPEKPAAQDTPADEAPKDKPASPTTDAVAEKSRTSSISSEKPDEIIISGSHEHKEKSPSPTTEKDTPESRKPSIISEKSPSPTIGDKSRTPSIVSDERDPKDISKSTGEKDKSPSPTVDEKLDKSRSPSIISEKSSTHLVPDDMDIKDKPTSPTLDTTTDQSRKSSISSEKPDEHVLSDDKAHQDKSPSPTKDQIPDTCGAPGIAFEVPDTSNIPDGKKHKESPQSPVADKLKGEIEKLSFAPEKPDDEDSHDDKIHKEKSASPTTEKDTPESRKPSIIPEKQDEKDALHKTIGKDRSPSPTVDEKAEQSRKPSTAAEEAEQKDIVDDKKPKDRSPSPTSDVVTEETRKPSTIPETLDHEDTSDDKVPKKKSPSPIASRKSSIMSDKPDEKDIPESKIQKDKSPSPTADDKTERHSRASSISSEKLDDEVHEDKSTSPTEDKILDKSRSPSISLAKPDDKDAQEKQTQKDKSPSPSVDRKHDRHSRTPSVSSEKHDDDDIPAALRVCVYPYAQIHQDDRAPSPTTDKLIDEPQSPGIGSEKLDEKDIAESKDKSPFPTTSDKTDHPSRTSSIGFMKPDEVDFIAQAMKDKAPSPVPATETDKSRSPSIVPEKPDEKDITDRKLQKDRSPSPTADEITVKPDQKELDDELPKDTSISPTTDKVTDRSRTSSIASEKLDVKSRSSSIVPEKLDDGDTSSPQDHKEKSPSPSTGEIIDYPKFPSVPDHKPEEKDLPKEDSTEGGKLDDKPEICKIPPKKLSVSDTPDAQADKEKSPSPCSDIPDKIRSPSISAEVPKEKDTPQASRPIGEKLDDKEPDQTSGEDKLPPSSDVVVTNKSRSPSVTSDKSDVKEPSERPKSRSILDEKLPQLDIVDQGSHKPDDKIVMPDESKSPKASPSSHEIVDTPKSGLSDSLKAPSSIKDETDISDQPTLDDHKPQVPKDDKPEDVSKPSGVTSSKPKDSAPQDSKKDDSAKSQSSLSEEPEEHPDTTSPIDKLKTLDIEPTDPVHGAKSQSPICEKTEKADSKSPSPSTDIVRDKSRSSSIASEKSDDLVRPSSRASGKSEPEEPAARHESPVPADHVGNVKEIHKSPVDASVPEEPKSPGGESDKSEKRDTTDSKSPRDRSPSYDRTPKDRSRSHSLFDTGDKTPLGRSRAASLFDDKLDDKITLLDLDAMRPSISEEIEDDRSPRKDDDSKPVSKSPSVADVHSPKGSRDAEIDDSDLPAGKRLEIEQYIIDEFILKSRKITSEIIEEIVIKKSVSRYIIIEIIEEIIIKRKIPRESVIGGDLLKEDPEVQSEQTHTEAQKIHDDKSPKSETSKSPSDSKRPSIASETIPVCDIPGEKTPRESISKEIPEPKDSTITSIVDDRPVEPEHHVIKKRSIFDEKSSEQDILDAVSEPTKTEPQEAVTGKDDDSEEEKREGRRPSTTDDKNQKLEPTEAKTMPSASPKSPETEALRKPSLPADEIPEFEEPKQITGDAKRPSVAENLISEFDSKKPDEQTKPEVKVIPTVIAKTEDGDDIHPEGFQDEGMIITDSKRIDIEEYVVEEYIKRGKIITREIVEEIVMRKSVPRYIILEIIEEIIIKRKIARTSVIDFIEEETTDKDDLEHADRSTGSSMSDKDDTSKLRKFSEDKFDMTTGKSTPEISSAKDQTIDFSGKSTPDLKSSLLSEKYSDKSGYSTPDMKQFDERSGKSTPDYRTEYESQFHKAFVGGMTEMRTTHITTLSGKSTPDFGAGRDDAHEHKPEIPSKSDLPSDKSDHPHDDGSKSPPPKDKAADTVPSSKGQSDPHEEELVKMPSDSKPSTTETTSDQSIFTTTISEITKATSDLVTKISESTASSISTVTSKIIASGVESDATTHESVPEDTKTTCTVTTVKTSEVESEPEIITKIVRHEVETHEHPETEIITRTIRHVTEIEEDEPEIITKVIKRESIALDDETTSSNTVTTITKTIEVETEPEIITKVVEREVESDEPSEIEVITKTVKHITEVEESDPEIITRVIKRVSIPAENGTAYSETSTTVTKTIETESEPDMIPKLIKCGIERHEPSHETTSSISPISVIETSEVESESEIFTKVIKREIETHEPSETEIITRTIRHVTEIEEGEPEIVRKVIRREIHDPTDETSSSRTFTTVTTSETESEPEIITKTIRREIEMHEPSETEVITRTIRHVTEVEESEPEIITKVIRREIIVPDDDDEEEKISMTTKISKVLEQDDSEHTVGIPRTSKTVTETLKSSEAPPDVVKRIISREGTPEVTETITTRTTRTIVSEASPSTETVTKTTTTTISSDIEKPELVTRIISREGTPEISETIKRTTKTLTSDSGPEYITKIISREGTPDILKSSEVKRIVTTVTTVTGPDGECVTTKDVKESSDKLDGEDLLEKLIDSSSSDKTVKSIPDVKTSEERFVSETPDGLITEEIIKRTVTTVTSSSGTSTPDVKSFIDSGKSTPDRKDDIKSQIPAKDHVTEKTDESISATRQDTTGRIHTEKITGERSIPEIPSTGLTKDVISEGKSYSGKSSPDVSLLKDTVSSGSTGKSTPDIPISPLIRDSSSIPGRILSGKSTPDRKSDGKSRTATPEGFRSGEVIRTIITTTRTMSDDGEIITVTKEVTESTDEQGQTTILEEKTNVKRDDNLPSRDAAETAISSVIGSIKASELKRGSSPGSDVMSDRDAGPLSPRSDVSSGHSRAATHVWGSSEERHTYSDDEPPSSPLSATSQFGYSPQQQRYELPFDKDSRKSGDIASAAMTGSFYGELPTDPAATKSSPKSSYTSSSTASKYSDPIPIQGEHSAMKRFTVEKEFAGGYEYKMQSKKYADDGDLDFDRAMMEHREKRGEDLVSHHYSNGSSSVVYTNGNSKEMVTTATSSEKKIGEKKKSDPMAASFSAEKETEEAGKSSKDPLEGWGKPLFLPSPKPPRKFNLQRPVASTSSEELNPESLNFDVINNWGEPLRLPSPAPAPAPTNEISNKGSPATPKKERKQPKKVVSENNKNKKRSESPSKNDKKTKDSKNKVQPVYMDLTYVPHHGNSYYSSLEFFKRIRARYYVFSGTEPSREVYDALLEAKKTWEDKNLEVTMIPTYDTDTLGYWVADNEEALAANHIDLSPSASRCTINLQDHETSCSAYRLEF